MDRPTTRTEADARGPRLDPVEALVLPSRRPALELCRQSPKVGGAGGSPVEGSQAGPVLLTGDAGVGKTWLWRRIEAESPPGCRWIAVDLTPSNDPADFYRLIGHELGLVDEGSRATPASRVRLVDLLAVRQADGERISLVIEEAHNLSADLWEEVRVLANRLDRPGGFASMILVGQTSLALRFSTRAFASIEARLTSRVHLGPIGVDEAKSLLVRLRPGQDWSDDEVELLHRDATGNPRRLLRLAGRVVPEARGIARESIADRRPGPRGGPAIGHRPVAGEGLAEAADRSPVERPTPVVGRGMVDQPLPIAPSIPLTGPARPPIRVGENMIEVGWSPEDSSAPAANPESPGRRVGPTSSPEGAEEAVRDHYAALQAWREWAENQARRSPEPQEIRDDLTDEAIEDDEESEGLEEDELPTPPPPRVDRPTVRVEGEQKFAPFGQLFSKMAQALEPE